MTPGAPNDDLAQQISTHLYTTTGLHPTPVWLHAFLQSARPNTPLKPLQQTALFRLLATDLITSTSTPTAAAVGIAGSFPAGVAEPDVRELRVPGPVTVQVLDVEDVSRSRWSQVEALEALEAEGRGGRQVVRGLADEGDAVGGGGGRAGEQVKESGVHKLLLQDARGTRVYALKLGPVRGVGVGMAIGCKLVLRDVAVARGLVLLEQENVEVLGGKVERWDAKWREERSRVLSERADVVPPG